MTAPDNVLFITADQWRGDCLSALGHPCLKTPNLDRLAAQGTLFTRHYTQATPCGPGRASLYTGLYLMNHRSVVNGAPLDARHSNVALEARKAGYDPALFGYTDVSADPRRHHPGDPALADYEGVLPGMTPIIHLKDDQRAWLADLKAKGYEVPPGHYGVFRPKPDFPGAAERTAIWRQVFPADVPSEHIDFERLGRLNLAGGGIQNVALNAAFAAARLDAPVGMSLILEEARREYEKLGRPIDEADFRWQAPREVA